MVADLIFDAVEIFSNNWTVGLRTPYRRSETLAWCRTVGPKASSLVPSSPLTRQNSPTHYVAGMHPITTHRIVDLYATNLGFSIVCRGIG